MKKLLITVFVFCLMVGLFTTKVSAVGDKVHGDRGVGEVYQKDPFGPGDQPDWQE